MIAPEAIMLLRRNSTPRVRRSLTNLHKFIVICAALDILLVMQVVFLKLFFPRAAASVLGCCLFLFSVLIPAHSQDAVFELPPGAICSIGDAGSGPSDSQGRGEDCCILLNGSCCGAYLTKTDSATFLPALTSISATWNIGDLPIVASRKPIFFTARGPPA